MASASPRLNLVVLRSADISLSADFYRSLDLSFTRHSHGSGPEHYASESCGITFEIYPASEKHPVSASTRIGFRVDSVDRAVERLSKLGAAVVSAPNDSKWGRRAVVKDPDGHFVELISPTG